MFSYGVFKVFKFSNYEIFEIIVILYIIYLKIKIKNIIKNHEKTQIIFLTCKHIETFKCVSLSNILQYIVCAQVLTVASFNEPIIISRQNVIFFARVSHFFFL